MTGRANTFGITKLWLQRIVREESAQDLIEYALLAGFISLVAVTAITSVGVGVNGVYNNINAQVTAIPGAGS
jgi:Flp pilus assembly pilin Flp